MDRRGGAAVTLGDPRNRLALCITCRNGVPLALRNFRHVYSWLIDQRLSPCISPGACSRAATGIVVTGIAQLSAGHAQNAVANIVGVFESALSKVVTIFNHFKTSRGCA